MAQAYFQAVKLPTLLHIPHPNTRLNSSRNDLNVEGRNSSAAELKFNSANKTGNDAKRCRSSIIASVLEDENKKREPKGSAKVSYDEMMAMINEKLSTGYHGVKHLFKAHNPSKKGVLNREGFKHVINSLCGYIPPDEWAKVLKRFQLEKNDAISFDEFISYFDRNEKVRKEILNSNQRIELFDLNGAPIVTDRHTHRSLAPAELSAVYCLSVMKAQARTHGFDPAKVIPSECLRNESLILPFHLDQILENFNLKLSDHEFKKLWRKFDLDNVGGIKSKVFLRLINYNPNEIDELSANMDKLRTKSCIISGTNSSLSSRSSRNYGYKTNRQSYIMDKLNTNKNTDETTTARPNAAKESLVRNENEKNKLQETNKPNELKNEINNNNSSPVKTEAAVKPLNVESNLIKESDKADKRDEIVDYYNQKPESAYRGTSFSETRVRYMVQRFKSSLHYKAKDNLITFLNNKLNAGYIAFRTAFEYIDPDNYGYLLNQEFEAVLKEFDIDFKPNEYQRFLKNHGLLKRNNLVNYKAFLYLFHDQGENSITQEVVKDAKNYMKTDDTDGLTAKEADFKIVNLYHGFYLSALNSFKQTFNNQQLCTFDAFKNILEKSFSIKTDNEQVHNLLKFIRQNERPNEISWVEFFKRFSEIDPWCYFKELKEKMISKARVANNETQMNAVLSKSNKQSNETTEAQKIDTTRLSSSKTNKINCEKTNVNDKKPDLQIVIQPSTEEVTVRPLKQLEKLVEILIRTKFHSLNKQFTLLDPKHSELIDREIFHTLMKKCGVEVNKPEVDLLWKDFHTEKVRFSNFVRRFFLPREFVYSYLEKEIEKNQLTQRSSQNLNDSFYSDPEDYSCSHNKKEETSIENIMEKIRKYITKNWYLFKQDFQIVDFAGTALISNAKAIEVFKKNKLPLTSKEIEEICKVFDIDQNSSKFDYISFMKSVSTSKSLAEINKSTPKWNTVHPSYEKIIKKLREIYKEKKYETNGLLRDFHILRAAFKKYDQTSKGHLTTQEFKDMLKECDIELNSEDLYKMFADFDPHLRGVFCYNIFMKTLIEKSF